jgi:valyl-tRNA synthetase
VLDTWFSSQLWPFATLGWPEQTDRLKAFYPTTVLSTARDIIYLWVARMIMMGLEFMGDVPFRDVIIHPTVLAADGRRMSKSLGTGVDPLELIADYGADATRFGLAYMSSVQDVRFSAERIEMGRNFANKIWNASRLVLQGAHPQAEPRVELVTPADRWIFSRLSAVIGEVAGLYESYEFDDVARALYRFVWNELCDWYLEVAKTRLYSDDETDRLQVSGNLLFLLEQVMALLHPLMPFVTEEVFGCLPQVGSGKRPASLFDASYPEAPAGWADPAAEVAMEAFTAVVAGLRSAREELGLPRDAVGKVSVLELQPGAASALAGLREAFRQLSGCELVAVVSEAEAPPGRFASVEAAGVKALLDLEGLVDVDRERERLRLKAQRATAEASKARAKLGNQGFLAKAPEAVIAEERARLGASEAILEEVRRQYEERIGGELPAAVGERP